MGHVQLYLFILLYKGDDVFYSSERIYKYLQRLEFENHNYFYKRHKIIMSTSILMIIVFSQNKQNM